MFHWIKISVEISSIALIAICIIFSIDGDWFTKPLGASTLVSSNHDGFIGASNDHCIHIDGGKGDNKDAWAEQRSLDLGPDFVALGDPDQNRVVIVKHEAGKNLRLQQIIGPPVNSVFHRIGKGFGYDVAIAGDRLVVGAVHEVIRPTRPELYRAPDRLGIATQAGAYLARIEASSVEGNSRRSHVALVPLDIPDPYFGGFAVAADASSIVVAARNTQETESSLGAIALFDLDGIPKGLIEGRRDDAFGASVDLAGGRLTVGAPRGGDHGMIYAGVATSSFDDLLQFSLEAPPGRTHGWSVANGDGFVAASAIVGMGPLATSITGPDFRPIDILPTGGRLAAAGRHLAIAQPESPDRERRAVTTIWRLTDDNRVVEVGRWLNADRVAIDGSLIARSISKEKYVEICISLLKP